MAVEFNRMWTEADVSALIGQSESIRREYKAGVMFDRDTESKWVEGLSKEVSALANTEGGELFLGIVEDKSKPRVATSIDGVPIKLAPERLQQLIEGNVSPYLPGICMHRIKLSASLDRVAYVIQVPQGSTAYQANDGRYYGRSEFEVKYLPDHEVRLRMMRGQVAQVQIEVCHDTYRTSNDEFQRRVKKAEEAEMFFEGWNKTDQPRVGLSDIRAKAKADFEKAKTELDQGKNEFDEYSFLLKVTNVGGTTIRDFLCIVQNMGCDSLFICSSPDEHCETNNRAVMIGSEISFRFAEAQVTVTSGDGLDLSNQKLWQAPEKKIFPRDSALLTVGRWVLRVPHTTLVDARRQTLSWTVFLDDAPPSSGVIMLDPNRTIPS